MKANTFSQLKKLIEDKEGLDIFEGIRMQYVSSRKAGHTYLMLLGIAEWIKKNPDKERPIIVCADERARFNLFESISEMPELEGVNCVTAEQFAGMRGIRVETPIAWDNFAILRLTDAGVKARQNITILERVLEDDDEWRKYEIISKGK